MAAPLTVIVDNDLHFVDAVPTLHPVAAEAMQKMSTRSSVTRVGPTMHADAARRLIDLTVNPLVLRAFLGADVACFVALRSGP